MHPQSSAGILQMKISGLYQNIPYQVPTDPLVPGTTCSKLLTVYSQQYLMESSLKVVARKLLRPKSSDCFSICTTVRIPKLATVPWYRKPGVLYRPQSCTRTSGTATLPNILCVRTTYYRKNITTLRYSIYSFLFSYITVPCKI